METAALDDSRHSLPRTSCCDEFTSRQLGLSRPTPLVSSTLIGVTQTSNAGHPKPPGAYHFDSSSSTHLQCPRINASQPTRPKPYCRNHREKESLTWPFALSPTVYNKGVDAVREKTTNLLRILHAVYIRNDGCHNVWQRAQTATLHYTPEDRLNDQRRNKTQAC